MSQTLEADLGLSKAQVEVFAAGLYQLAACDGIDDREIAIVREFCEEAGHAELCGRLDSLHFDPATAYRTLESSWLRKLFLRASLLVIRADEEITDTERETLSWMAVAFGIAGGYEAIVAEIEGQSL